MLKSHVQPEVKRYDKVGCVFPMVILSILLRAKFGRNHQRENAAHISIQFDLLSIHNKTEGMRFDIIKSCS